MVTLQKTAPLLCVPAQTDSTKHHLSIIVTPTQFIIKLLLIATSNWLVLKHIHCQKYMQIQYVNANSATLAM